MARDLFYVPIFFICMRESLEAAIIVAVLLSLVEQLMTSGTLGPNAKGPDGEVDVVQDEQEKLRIKRVLRRMRIQIWAGAGAGFLVALSIGAAFIAVFYLSFTDLWAKAEDIWEGAFSLLASGLIFIMAIAFLSMDRSRMVWRIKLSEAFDTGAKKSLKVHGILPEEGSTPAVDGDVPVELASLEMSPEEKAQAKKRARNGKWALFLLPFITVVREGLEAVVFIGGVSLNVPAAEIPLAVIVGLICGGLIGYLIYRGGNAVALHWFLVVSTAFLFLIGAGLFSKGIGSLQLYKFVHAVGSDVAEAGDGPGSFQVAGNVWHLVYGNPEPGSATTNGGWQMLNAIFGWNNTATIGTITGYCAYWIAVVLALVQLKWKEGRITFFGRGSAAYWRIKKISDARHAREEDQEIYSDDEISSPTSAHDDKKVEPAPIITLGLKDPLTRDESRVAAPGY